MISRRNFGVGALLASLASFIPAIPALAKEEGLYIKFKRRADGSGWDWDNAEVWDNGYKTTMSRSDLSDLLLYGHGYRNPVTKYADDWWPRAGTVENYELTRKLNKHMRFNP